MSRVIVAFHVGRGGRFNNGGHITYIGESNFTDLIGLNDSHLYYQDRVKGKFSKPYYSDCNGTIIVDTDEYGKEVGTLEFDTIYDTDYCKYIEDCNDSELELISNYTGYKSYELELFLKEFENNLVD
jgi:2',3'-cyclic-nucleotide 2'-phosphodiesterase (5'-nucleotidase family)